jgi:hypothetical protein
MILEKKWGHQENEPPRRKRRGINWKIVNAPMGEELNHSPTQAD